MAGAAMGIAGGVAAGTSLLDSYLSYKSSQDAIDAQKKQFQQQLELMREIYSRENIYSPEQLMTQSAMFPIQHAMLGQAIGAGDWYSSELWRTQELALKADIEQLNRNIARWNKEKGQGLDKHARKRRDESIKGAQAKRDDLQKQLNLIPRQRELAATGSKLYEAMRGAKETELAHQAGAERSALDIGKRNAMQELMASNRAMMGSGASGHIAGSMRDLEEAYMRTLPQLETSRELGMQNWRMGEANKAISGLINTGFQQPLGNMPYTPPQPPAPYADMTWANMANQFGNLATTYAFMKGQNKNQPMNYVPSVNPMSGLYTPHW